MIRLPSILLFAGLTVAYGQEIPELRQAENGLLVNPLELPEVNKATSLPDEHESRFLSQEEGTLEVTPPVESDLVEMPELVSLRERTVYRVVARSESIPVASVNGDRIGNDLQKVSAAYRKTGQAEKDCRQPALSIEQRVKKNPSIVLEIVDAEIRANPGCACEIVKAAILATDMKVESVVAIVKVAIEANPETMRLVAQCAIAVCPDALEEIQALLAKYDGGSLEGDSAKSAKSAKGEEAAANSDEVAAMPNPLDFPGGPDGEPSPFPPVDPPFPDPQPPRPPPVTRVDPD